MGATSKKKKVEKKYHEQTESKTHKKPFDLMISNPRSGKNNTEKTRSDQKTENKENFIRKKN